MHVGAYTNVTKRNTTRKRTGHQRVRQGRCTFAQAMCNRAVADLKVYLFDSMYITQVYRRPLLLFAMCIMQVSCFSSALLRRGGLFLRKYVHTTFTGRASPRIRNCTMCLFVFASFTRLHSSEDFLTASIKKTYEIAFFNLATSKPFCFKMGTKATIRNANKPI